jgi:hypothetical protein
MRFMGKAMPELALAPNIRPGRSAHKGLEPGGERPVDNLVIGL